MEAVGERIWGVMSHKNKSGREDVVLANNNVHHPEGKLVILLGSKKMHI
jgi:hypothetical protein